MLDITNIPVVDNHCHPLLLKQQMDVMRFRRCFTEAADGGMTEKHVQNSVYYLWMLRQMAGFLGCKVVEEKIIAARNERDADALLADLAQRANVETLILDTGYPPPDECYTPERTGEVSGCRIARLLRLEVVMQELIVAHDSFDEVVERFANAVSSARAQGYCGLKSVVAYRTGLHIAMWKKDEAVRAFAEARAEARQKGVARVTQKPLLDYLLHIAFAKAAEQEIPIQFHTGYGDSDTDMRLGNPLHLRDVLERREYQTMPIVLLHESYPYTQLGAYLAAIYPHVYFDLSYAIPFVDKLEMLAFTRQALGVAPASKLLFSTDGIFVPEMHCFGAVRGRSVLQQILQEMIDADEIDEGQGSHLAKLILHDNANALYGL